MRAAIWKLKKVKESTSHLWIVIKKEIITFGLVTLVTPCLILNKPCLKPENSCNKKWAKRAFQDSSILISCNILPSSQNFKLFYVWGLFSLCLLSETINNIHQGIFNTCQKEKPGYASEKTGSQEQNLHLPRVQR